MVYTDWTFSGSNSGSLDGTTKYAGVSSYKSYLSDDNTGNVLTHDNFLENQVQIISWIRSSNVTATDAMKAMFNHSQYGSKYFLLDTANDWQKFRMSFWYDIDTDIKWGRLEKWVDSNWVQQEGDQNFGNGAPAAGTIGLGAHRNYVSPSSGNMYLWFDEVEVYS